MGVPMMAHLQWNPFIGFCFHESLLMMPPAPFPVPVPKGLHITFNTINGIYLGSLPTTQPGAQIQGPGGLPFMGRTTDAGMITPHVGSLAPLGLNLTLPLTILFGESQVLLGASKVQVATYGFSLFAFPPGMQSDSEAIGVCTIPYAPISTNWGCNDRTMPSVPLDFVINWGTVYAGVTLMDLFVMLGDVGLGVLMDKMGALKKFGKQAGKKARKKLLKKFPKPSTRVFKGVDLVSAARKKFRDKIDKFKGKVVATLKKKVRDSPLGQAWARRQAKKAQKKREKIRGIWAEAEMARDLKLESVQDRMRRETGVRELSEEAQQQARREADEAANEAYNKLFRQEFPPESYAKFVVVQKYKETLKEEGKAALKDVKDDAREDLRDVAEQELGVDPDAYDWATDPEGKAKQVAKEEAKEAIVSLFS